MRTRDELLREYVSLGCWKVSETSGSIKEGYQTVVNTAKEYARDLQIQWTDEFIPDYVLDCLNDYGFPHD